MNKHDDEKKEKGAAQIIVPNNLIFSGRMIELFFFCSIISIKKFFLGFKIITCRLDDDPLIPPTIQDCFVNIHIEDYQLLNETLAKEFNPLTITISHVENMPSTPISYSELKQRLNFLLKKNFFTTIIYE